jgi:hypothetical protein
MAAIQKHSSGLGCALLSIFERVYAAVSKVAGLDSA